MGNYLSVDYFYSGETPGCVSPLATDFTSAIASCIPYIQNTLEDDSEVIGTAKSSGRLCTDGVNGVNSVNIDDDSSDDSSDEEAFINSYMKDRKLARNFYKNIREELNEPSVFIENPTEDQKFDQRLKYLQTVKIREIMNKLKKSPGVGSDDYLAKIYFDREKYIASEDNRNFPFPYAYRHYDPIPLLKLKNKETYPIQDKGWLNSFDVILRQNIQWKKLYEEGVSGRMRVITEGEKKTFIGEFSPNWALNYCPVLSEHHCWCPENIMPVLAQIINSHKQTPIDLSLDYAAYFVNTLWKKDLEERKKDPDNPSKVELNDAEKKDLFDSLVLLIVARHDFIKSDKVLDLYRYIPFPPGPPGFNYDCQKNYVLYTYGIYRKLYPFFIGPPTDDSEKIEQRLEDIKTSDKSSPVYDEVLEEFQNVFADMYKAYDYNFGFIVPNLQEELYQSKNIH